MHIPILQTRLKPPALQENMILRSDLLEKMRRGAGRTLTLISAPAGYGKTTLAVQWLHEQKRSFFWLSIDPVHRDSRLFLQYLLTSLSMEYYEFNSSFWQIPQQQSLWDPYYLLGHLINRIEEMRLDFILVLDDYHLIDSPEINELTGFILENLPRSVQVIILSRSNPHLALAKMRAKRDLAEIHSRDLQFDEREAQRLILENSDLILEESDVRDILQRSEGWVTGIQLAMMSYRDHTSEPNRYLNDYLFEEMLENEEETLVAFLYNTSVLTYLNASLCDALLPELQGGSGEILTQLIRKNFFIKAIDGDGEWFSLHALLRAVLLKNRKCDVEELHIRAARWFRQEEQYSESLYHYLSARAYSTAAEQLELIWPVMERNFNVLTWLKWSDELPEEEKDRHLLLLSQIAWAQLQLGQMKACEISMRKLEKLIGTGEAEKSLLIQIYSARAYYSVVKRELEKAVEYADLLENLADESNPFPGVEARSYKALSIWLKGNLDEAYRSFTDFRDEMMAMGIPAFALGTTLALIQIRMRQGRNNEALEIFKEALDFADDPGEQLDKVKASLYLRAAAVYFELGEPDLMNELLRMSESLSRSDSLVDYHYQYHQFKALIYESEGKLEKALEALNEAEHLFVQTPGFDDITIAEQKFRVLIRMKKKTTAKRIMRFLFQDAELYPSYQFESRLMVKCRYVLEFHGDPDELHPILDLLNSLSDLSLSEGRQRSLIELLILKALVLYNLNEKDESYDVLNRVLILADETGLLQAVHMDEENLQPLFREFAGKLKSVDAYQSVKSYLDRSRTSSRLLSEREREVLQYMAEGLSNKSIGEKLFVAESTVKGHNQRIFQKLNVSKRTEAIAEGRKLGLID